MSMELIQESALYQSRQRFTASDMASVLGLSRAMTMTWLRDMAYEGQLIVAGSEDDDLLYYSAPPKLKRAMMRRPWNRRLAREVSRAVA